MMIKHILERLPLVVLLLALTTVLKSQTTPFELYLEPLEIPDLGGLQSFAYGEANGKWLIVGGRLDGLHRRQPFAAFEAAGKNNQIWVIDPAAKSFWTASLGSLPTAIQEQLSSTNMEFFQEGGYLYCVGGYGYSPSAGDHVTYDKLTAIDVETVIEAIVNDNAFAQAFRQITDPAFQVTGGHLNKIGAVYYLMGGQKFMGRYNPMGPDHGPGFEQEYTNSIRRFTIADNGESLTINHLETYTDDVNLHRRDYNAEAQILPNGRPGLTMFSGVFRPDVNLPFLNSVNIDSAGYSVNQDFEQYFNHYHCPVLPLYAAADNKMYTVFFGGIAQYYFSEGTLVQDDNVPFVRTIAAVSRTADGTMTEERLPIEMPSLLGAGAVFIPELDLPHFENNVFKLDDFSEDTLLVGYIYGGISSTQPNIFFTNNGTQSDASQQIFKVYLKKNQVTSVIDRQETNDLKIRIYPNPSSSSLQVEFNLKKSSDLRIDLCDASGKIILQRKFEQLQNGLHNVSLGEMKGLSSGVYFIRLETADERGVQKWLFDN
jgi:hypothetical protein